MAASKHDFNIEQGTSFRLSITHKDNEGNIINISNYCARLIWTTNDGITYTFSTLTNGPDYRFTVDGPNGQFLLLLPASTTNNYNFNTAKYDLEIQSPSDLYVGGGKQTLRILYGLVTITKRYSSISSPLDCA